MLNPFLFDRQVRAVILSYKAPLEVVDLLAENGVEVCYTTPFEGVSPPVADHVDLQIHPLDYNTFICPAPLVDYYHNILDRYEVQVLPCEGEISPGYPSEAGLNAGRIGNHIIQNPDVTEKRLKDELEQRDYDCLSIKQGYGRCSALTIREKVVITADRGIAKACVEAGYDVVIGSDTEILLPGYDHGFLGGIGGMIDRDRLLFFGDVSTLPDGEKLLAELATYGIISLYPPGLSVRDLGGLIGIH